MSTFVRFLAVLALGAALQGCSEEREVEAAPPGGTAVEGEDGSAVLRRVEEIEARLEAARSRLAASTSVAAQELESELDALKLQLDEARRNAAATSAETLDALEARLAELQSRLEQEAGE